MPFPKDLKLIYFLYLIKWFWTWRNSIISLFCHAFKRVIYHSYECIVVNNKMALNSSQISQIFFYYDEIFSGEPWATLPLLPMSVFITADFPLLPDSDRPASWHCTVDRVFGTHIITTYLHYTYYQLFQPFINLCSLLLSLCWS